MASQMAPARLDNTRVDIAAGPEDQITRGEKPFVFRATGSIIKFPGWMAVYQQGRDEGDTDELDRGALPELAEGEALNLLKLLPDQHFTQPPPRFTEATLVKALEEQGIGRPSTYVPTIATLQARNYVTVEERKLVPTELGFVVNDLLVEHFPNVFDIGFTSQLEGELDDIASGERAWVPTLEQFYQPFTETLKRAEQTMEPDGHQARQVRKVPGVQRLPRVSQFEAAADTDRCRVPDVPSGRSRGAPLEEGAEVLWLRALPGVRFCVLEQAGQQGVCELWLLHGRSWPGQPAQVLILQWDGTGVGKGRRLASVSGSEDKSRRPRFHTGSGPFGGTLSA
jgi:hypothetical protein